MSGATAEDGDSLCCEPGVAPGFRTWRLLYCGASQLAWNMAADEAILDAVCEGLAPPTLRLYRWAEPAVSVGRFQNIQRDLDVASCAAHGIPLVRRPTGGRAILHGSDQTLSIVVPVSALRGAGRSVAASYLLLSQGIVAALRGFGIHVAVGPAERRRARAGDCFAVRTQADLVTEAGDKIVGSAQLRRHCVLLQQSSLRHRPPEVDPASVFVGPVSAQIYPLRDVAEEDLVAALADGFRGALGVRPMEGVLSQWECERAGFLISRYRPLVGVDSRSTV